MNGVFIYRFLATSDGFRKNFYHLEQESQVESHYWKKCNFNFFAHAEKKELDFSAGLPAILLIFFPYALFEEFFIDFADAKFN